MDFYFGNAPQITGSLDENYLEDALARSGRAADISSELKYEELKGGHTGATVTALHLDSALDYVHKAIPTDRGVVDALGTQGEAQFWLDGLTRDLPAPIQNPTLDVAYHEGRDQWWLLMDDVSSGMVGRDSWTEDHTRRLFEGLATLHGAHWEMTDEEGSALNTLEATTAVLAEPVAYVATGNPPSSKWVQRVADEIPLPNMFVPPFLDVLDESDGQFFVDLCSNWRDIVDALEGHRHTLIHGDVCRGNSAFLDDRVILFDWELAARAPAAVDLTWHWFLRYWIYAPDDGKAPRDRLSLRDAYVDGLEEELGASIDRQAFEASWDLGWLRVFVLLGYILVDPITGPDPSAEDIERGTARCKEAVAEARRIADAHLG